jgi:cellulose synthase/poly-beta-1,6-N-acetylglucosamine synthase-like glycosyltransferase
VTEDCDLGLRLAKRGYNTAIFDSTTNEEANSQVKNWFWQRSRWIKGYMQSYLVHTRNLKTFFQHGKITDVVDLIAFQSVIGGRIFALFINPLMWLLTAIYFIDRPVAEPIVKSLYLAPVLYMGVFCLVFGNFMYMYYYMIGCAKKGFYELIPYSFLVPFYWLAMSVAAWLALYKLITAPHHWSKTVHGFHLEPEIQRQQIKQTENPSFIPGQIGVYS